MACTARLTPSFPLGCPSSRLLPACLLAASIVLFQPGAAAQEGEHPGEAEVSSIDIEGNSAIGTNELQAQMQTRETPGFLNKFLYHTISIKLGRKDEYFSPAVFGQDIVRLKKYYDDRGFSRAMIDTTIAFAPDGRSVDLKLVVHEGYRSVVDTLTYRGWQGSPGQVWVELQSGQKIARGDPFNRALLEDEIRRVLRILYNYGYPKARFLRDADTTYCRRYVSTNNYAISLSFDKGRQCVFGPITIEQDVDTLRGGVRRDDITDDIILTQLDYHEGELYSLESKVSSERNLSRLGIFDQATIQTVVPADPDTSRSVPSLIIVRPKDKHELAPELIVSDENSAFNLGTGLAYTERNFLGGARTLTTGARFRTQTLTQFPNYFGTNTEAVSNFELTTNMVQPYIFSNKIKGSWSLSYIIDKQLAYRTESLRNKFGFTDRFAEFTNGFLDWTLERVHLVKNDVYLEHVQDPVTLQLLDAQARQVQFVSVLSFTIQRDMTNDIFSPSDGFVHAFTIEEAGLLPLLLKKAEPDLPFTQFYRLSGLGRWYSDLSGHRFSILAFKLKGGFEEKYGESRSDPNRAIPQTHRFYAGGGGSVRGWNSRDLIASGDPQVGGNLALEGSVELRTNILQAMHDGLLDKIWIVLFTDVGNVWGEVRDFQFRTAAIAAGMGLRYDTFFGPFRLDWGFKVYNPTGSAGQQWISDRRFFGQTVRESVFHFGIGNAF